MTLRQAASVLTESVLARPGTPSSKDVAVGEQADDEPFDQIGLADDDLADFVKEGADESAGSLDFFVDCRDAGVHFLKGKRGERGRKSKKKK